MSSQIQPNQNQWESPIGRTGKTPEDLRPIGTQFTSLEPPNVGYDDCFNNHGNPKYWEALSYEVVGHFQVSYHPFRLLSEPEKPEVTVWKERLKLHEWFITDWTEIPEGDFYDFESGTLTVLACPKI